MAKFPLPSPSDNPNLRRCLMSLLGSGELSEVLSGDPPSAGPFDVILVVPNIRKSIAPSKTAPVFYLHPGSPAEFGAEAIECAIQESFGLQSRAGGLTGSRDEPYVVGNSPPIQDLKAYLQRLQSTDANVLITGETGTGKELVAELIHGNGPRRNAPFVCINCAAIPDTLLESELFGYERGAFTGAHSAAIGKLELANGGTVFLDEIGDMSACAQAKLLRAIERKEIQRLGSKRPIRLDFRIIAATNQKLDSGSAFRRDLFYRLNVARIDLPPLRERKADIPLLVDHYIRVFNARYLRNIRAVTDEVGQLLASYDWPGNVRELKNLIEAAFVNASSDLVDISALPPTFSSRTVNNPESGTEREQLLAALRASDWNKSKAAKKLSWSRMTLYRKLAKYGCRRDAWRQSV